MHGLFFMPISSQRPCGHPGCSRLVRGTSHCKEHKKSIRRLSDQRRCSAASRGYGHKWRQARLGFLNKHPFCVRCEEEGIDTRSTIVDHIIPHKDDKEMFWDRSNWQALCKKCHDKKTALEDGGFGRTGGYQKSEAIFF